MRCEYNKRDKSTMIARETDKFKKKKKFSRKISFFPYKYVNNINNMYIIIVNI